MDYIETSIKMAGIMIIIILSFIVIYTIFFSIAEKRNPLKVLADLISSIMR